jgi:hypothetical protein
MWRAMASAAGAILMSLPFLKAKFLLRTQAVHMRTPDARFLFAQREARDVWATRVHVAHRASRSTTEAPGRLVQVHRPLPIDRRHLARAAVGPHHQQVHATALSIYFDLYYYLIVAFFEFVFSFFSFLFCAA